MTNRASNRSGGSPVQALDLASAAAYLVYSSSAAVTPICLVILARELGFSLTAAGTLEVARSVLVVATLLLSGFIAGRLGKALSLGYSAMVLGLGMVIYTMAPTYGVVLIALAFLGVGGGVLEGLLNPLIQDLHPQDSGRYLNFLNGFWSVGILGTFLITGDLLTREISWRYVVAVLGMLSFASGALFLIFNRRLYRSRRQSLAEVWQHKKHIVSKSGFWPFFVMMFLAGAVEGAYTFWSASLIQLDYNAQPRAGGIATAWFAAGMILGRFGSGWWVRQHRLRQLMLASALSALPLAVAIPFLQQLYLNYAVLFLTGLAIACFWPSIQSYAADCLDVEVTSLFILLSCGGISGFAFASWTMGWIGDFAGLRISFSLIPALLLLLAVLFGREKRPS